ncbi:MAG TPA: DUF3617 family protein [Caulobacteraceae bacterium]|nr:DUF3617 family protein [Caulobacteraceae bacterium]
MTRLIIVACAAAALPFQSLAAETSPILPGYWESTDTVTSPIQQSKTSRKCITADQIESYLTGPVNNHYRCRYNDRKLDGHNFSMTGDCVDSSGIPAKVAIEGVYTPTSFTMNGRIRIVIGGLGIPVSASTDAHRISAECPPPGAPPAPAPDAPSAPGPSDSAPPPAP